MECCEYTLKSIKGTNLLQFDMPATLKLSEADYVLRTPTVGLHIYAKGVMGELHKWVHN